MEKTKTYFVWFGGRPFCRWMKRPSEVWRQTLLLMDGERERERERERRRERKTDPDGRRERATEREKRRGACEKREEFLSLVRVYFTIFTVHYLSKTESSPNYIPYYTGEGLY